MPEESTTPDLVELSHHFVEAANRRDFDALLSFFAPDAVWEAGGFGTTFEGVEAIRGFWQDWFASYEELWAGLEEYWTWATEWYVACSSRKPVLLTAVVRFDTATHSSSFG